MRSRSRIVNSLGSYRTLPSIRNARKPQANPPKVAILFDHLGIPMEQQSSTFRFFGGFLEKLFEKRQSAFLGTGGPKRLETFLLEISVCAHLQREIMPWVQYTFGKGELISRYQIQENAIYTPLPSFCIYLPHWSILDCPSIIMEIDVVPNPCEIKELSSAVQKLHEKRDATYYEHWEREGQYFKKISISYISDHRIYFFPSPGSPKDGFLGSGEYADMAPLSLKQFQNARAYVEEEQKKIQHQGLREKSYRRRKTLLKADPLIPIDIKTARGVFNPFLVEIYSGENKLMEKAWHSYLSSTMPLIRAFRKTWASLANSREKKKEIKLMRQKIRTLLAELLGYRRFFDRYHLQTSDEIKIVAGPQVKARPPRKQNLMEIMDLALFRFTRDPMGPFLGEVECLVEGEVKTAGATEVYTQIERRWRNTLVDGTTLYFMREKWRFRPTPPERITYSTNSQLPEEGLEDEKGLRHFYLGKSREELNNAALDYVLAIVKLLDPDFVLPWNREDLL